MGVIFLKKFSIAVCNYIFNNKALFILLFIVFTVGMVIGAYSLDMFTDDKLLEMRKSTDIYFSVSELNSVDKSEIFIELVKKNVLAVFYIWLSGFFVFLLPVVFVQILLKGVRLGFSLAYFTAVYGFKGAFFSSARLLLGNFLILPILFFYSVHIIKFSKEKHKLSVKRCVVLKSLLPFILACVILLITGGINSYILYPVFRLIGAFV